MSVSDRAEAALRRRNPLRRAAPGVWHAQGKSDDKDMLFRIMLFSELYYVIKKKEFLHFVIGLYPFFPNHYPIPLSLGIRQAQRYTTSLQVDIAT